jgi:hypothetical protein
MVADPHPHMTAFIVFQKLRLPLGVEGQEVGRRAGLFHVGQKSRHEVVASTGNIGAADACLR